ncbi:MAG: ABC transporter permease [Candidatus Heimdallarchaeum aukensis]|uniref:ABC transporter permease n=1 Tax=Candidatus Heimdallarchaeum aukensis TaxID=2876573 RepID=A0A9Y1BLU4_9ARCH|nr:MAG: ABC transporter permease [Candidatus Heimdallarchaeum aukensis]
MILYLTLIRIKQIIREKEFYFYVIVFPLFFLILFGFLSSSWVQTTTTIPIGYISEDLGISDDILNETIMFDEAFYNFLNKHHLENNIKTFEIHNYTEVNSLENDINNRIIDGGIVIPFDFSEQMLNISRFYSSLILVNFLGSQFNTYASESANISAAINSLSSHLQGTANLSLLFYGDITIDTAMTSYSVLWQVINDYVQNTTLSYTEKIWKVIKNEFDLSFNFSSTSNDSSQNSITYSIIVVDSGTGELVTNFRKEYISNILPGQIIQSILMSSISVIWLTEMEERKEILKRLKLTKLTAGGYIGSIILAWGTIALLQGLFLITVSAVLGFFSFSVGPLAWLMTILTLVFLGFITATISLLVTSFIKPRTATPILVLSSTVLAMFVGEYFFQVKPAFTFAKKNFTWLDIFPVRPAFLVMKNALLLGKNGDITILLFDFALVVLWTILIFAISSFAFSKLKLKYIEKE